MDRFDDVPMWLFVIAIGIVCFLLGRATARNRDIDRADEKLRDAEAAQTNFGALPPDSQADVDRLVMENKLIEAIKLVRERTGLGLKEAKALADGRRKALKG